MSEQFAKVASSAAIEHLRWSLTPEVGPIHFRQIVKRFGSAQEALGASVTQLEQLEGIGTKTAETIARGRDSVDLQAEVECAAQHNVRIICQDDDEYPELLRFIPDPPICLYVRGQLKREDGLAVAIVGARRCSIYGREQAHRFAYQLASHHMTIISGLARGIDSEGHKGALQANGRTLAVLGNGLATIYPPENRDLADRITTTGAVISELPMTTSPDSKNFLPRNRIIAGLSLGTLVIEAAKRSGALATARLACDYDREVFALPGRVDSESSAGTNALIRDQHGKLVLTVEDILNELGEAGEILQQQAGETQADLFDPPPSAVLTENEQAISSALDREGKSIERIADEARLPAHVASSTLITLQLKGIARQLPGQIFVRVGER